MTVSDCPARAGILLPRLGVFGNTSKGYCGLPQVGGGAWLGWSTCLPAADVTVNCGAARIGRRQPGSHCFIDLPLFFCVARQRTISLILPKWRKACATISKFETSTVQSDLAPSELVFYGYELLTRKTFPSQWCNLGVI